MDAGLELDGARPGRTEAGPGDWGRGVGLDQVIQRIFTAGVLLGNAMAGGLGAVAAIEDAIGELDEAVRLASSVPRASGPGDGLGALAALLAQAERDLTGLAASRPGGMDLSLRDAAYSLHRAQDAVSKAWARLLAARSTAADELA